MAIRYQISNRRAEDSTSEVLLTCVIARLFQSKQSVLKKSDSIVRHCEEERRSNLLQNFSLLWLGTTKVLVAKGSSTEVRHCEEARRSNLSWNCFASLWLGMKEGRGKQGRHFVFLFLIVLLFVSCTKNGAYEARLKSLDSLSGALNQKLSELRQVDTVILQKAISKYNNYRQFIQQNVNDTVNKEEANHLQQFYVCGKNLSDFSVNRSTILARGTLLNSQINKLIVDVKTQSIDEEKLSQFSLQEKQTAEDLLKISFQQQQLFQANLQEFKLSLRGIESLIRSRNNGQMPTVIKDSIPL